MTDAAPTPPLGNLAHAMAYLSTLLVEGEKVIAWSPQRRLHALFHRRVILIATTGRLLEFHRKILGGYNLFSVRWQDIERADIRSGIFSADVVVRAYDMPDFMSSDLAPNARLLQYTFRGFEPHSAAAVYRIAQHNEQAWREKRRTRQMEELRAKSGGFAVGGSGGVGALSQAAVQGSPTDRLATAKGMLEKGLISDSEFETIKARIVGEI